MSANNSFINQATQFVIVGFIAASCIQIFSNAMQINLLNDYFVRELYSEEAFSVLADKNDVRSGLLSGVWVLFLFLSFFIIGGWFYVSAKQNQSSAVKNLSVTPGWAVGWFFVPFANLVMPYRALKEIYKASFNNAEWEQNPIPHYFPVWWATWIVTNVVSNIQSKMDSSLGDSYTFQQLNDVSYVAIVSNATGIVSAYFLLKIVVAVAKNQNEQILQTAQSEMARREVCLAPQK